MKKRSVYLYAAVTLLLAACQPAEQKLDYIETEEQLLTSFVIRKADNPFLHDDIEFKFDSATQTYYYHTQQFVDSIHTLIPTFFADGNAYVKGKEVIPCVTPQDFSIRPVTYQIRKGNFVHNYSVEFRCPQSTGLPVLDILTDNGKDITSKTEYSESSVSIYTQGDAKPCLQQRAGIRGRGNSTWWYPKKPYRLKLEKKAGLFGMQPAKAWVLLANAIDPTLLCNTVALEIANRMGFPYVNHTQPVELFINRRYCGSYVLTEAVQVKKDRVAVDTLVGGFLSEIDSNYDELYKARSRWFSLPVMMKAPESREGLNNVMDMVNDLEKALNKTNFSYADYYQIVDVESVIRYMLLNELCKNGEVCHPKSIFVYRENKNDLLHFGPPWDFDWAYGYTGGNFHYFTYPEDLLFHAGNTNGAGSKLFGSFLKDPVFRYMYAQQWKEYVPRLQDLDQYIYGQAEILRYSQEENAIRWGQERINYETYTILMADFLQQRIDAISNELMQYE